jgi:predicted Zn-dependent protease
MPARSRPVLALFGAMLLLAACETAPVTGRSQMMLVSESEEQQLGLQAYRQVRASAPPSKNTVANEMVERVGWRIAKAAEKPPGELWKAPHYHWEFTTIDKNVANAFCLPGGKIAVYTGLLPITRDETGLAVVMGHEVAHALARHAAERISDQRVAQAGSAVAAVALGTTEKGNSGAYTPAIASALGVATNVGFLLPMSRAQESEADRIGLVLMARAGYDPREAVALWERMRAADAGKSKTPTFLSTHPTDATRIAQIREWIPEAMKYYRPQG